MRNTREFSRSSPIVGKLWDRNSRCYYSRVHIWTLAGANAGRVHACTIRPAFAHGTHVFGSGTRREANILLGEFALNTSKCISKRLAKQVAVHTAILRIDCFALTTGTRDSSCLHNYRTNNRAKARFSIMLEESTEHLNFNMLSIRFYGAFFRSYTEWITRYSASN